jgi:hypothetical protein
MAMSSLNPYLAKLQACLGDLPPFVQRDVIEELRGHLEDRASSLQLRGISEEASMSEAIERFGEAGEVGAALRHVHRRVSWGKVGLAVLPGLFAISTIWIANGTGRLAAIGLGMYVLLGIVGFLLERRFAAWSFTALGMLLGLTSVLGLLVSPLWLLAAIVALVVYRRRGIHIPDLVWVLLGLMIAVGAVETAVLTATDGVFFWSYLLVSLAPVGGILLPVAVGLLLARRSGVLAGLFVVAAGFALVDWMLEPTYGLWNTHWSIILPAIQSILLLIISPLWVLRSRSMRGRIWGLLLPAFIALASIATIVCTVREYPIETWCVNGGAAAQLFMGMALAVLLYHWAESQWAGHDEEAIDQKLCNPLLVRGI